MTSAVFKAVCTFLIYYTPWIYLSIYLSISQFSIISGHSHRGPGVSKCFLMLKICPIFHNIFYFLINFLNVLFCYCVFNNRFPYFSIFSRLFLSRFDIYQHFKNLFLNNSFLLMKPNLICYDKFVDTLEIVRCIL